MCRPFQVLSLSLSGPFASSKPLCWQLARLAFPFKLGVLETALEKGNVTGTLRLFSFDLLVGTATLMCVITPVCVQGGRPSFYITCSTFAWF